MEVDGCLAPPSRQVEGEDEVLSGGREPGGNPDLRVATQAASPRGGAIASPVGRMWWWSMLQDTLEKELKEWRESRSRMHAAAAEARVKTFSSHAENRRVKVNGQEVVVVSRAKRPS